MSTDYDYHLLPVASEIIGKAQAEVIAAQAGVGGPPHDARPDASP